MGGLGSHRQGHPPAMAAEDGRRIGARDRGQRREPRAGPRTRPIVTPGLVRTHRVQFRTGRPLHECTLEIARTGNPEGRSKKNKRQAQGLRTAPPAVVAAVAVAAKIAGSAIGDAGWTLRTLLLERLHGMRLPSCRRRRAWTRAVAQRSCRCSPRAWAPEPPRPR